MSNECLTRGSDRRQFSRCKAEIPVKISQNGDTPIICNAVDISEGGICISSDKDIPEKEYIVSIEHDSLPALNLPVEVKWRNRDPEKNILYDGVQFKNLSALDRLKVREVIKKMTQRFIISREFINTIGEFKEFLAHIEEVCRQFDSHEPTEKQKVLFIKNEGPFIFKEFDNFWNRLNDMSKSLSALQFKIYKNFLQEHILYYFIRDSACLNKQVYEKPLGYAGDFVIANYFYEDSFPGESTFGKLVNRYSLVIPIGRAYVKRRKYFGRMIADTIRKSQGEYNSVNITSFACGPAIEVIDTLNSDIPLDNVYFNLMDGEKLVIEQIINNIKNLSTKAKVNLSVKNILAMIRNGDKYSIKPSTQDLIYSAGFMDYLNDINAKKLIQYAYSLIRKNGKAVISNMTPDNPHQFFLETIGEWKLNYRSREKLINLAKECLPDAENIACEDGETKRDAFLIIQKGA